MDSLRDFLKSWLGRALLIVCLASMAFLGMGDYFFGSALTAGQVARVGDIEVSTTSLQNEMNSTRNELLQRVDASLINEDALKAQILDNVIDRTLLEIQTQALGMRLSDEALSRILQTDPTFLDAEGNFSNDLFAQFLTQQGITKDVLFENMRKQMNIRQLTATILTAIYPMSQVNRLIDLQMDARQVWVQRLNWQTFADKVTVSDSEISAYYDANKDKLTAPAMVDLSYVELSPEALTVPAPTQAELEQAYANYLKDNQLGAKELAQILLTGSDAMQKAEKVQAELKAGKDFSELAKTYSEDPSGQSGGAIGKYNAAVFGADASKVDAAIAKLTEGQVSEPVQTSFGVHLFKVTGMAQAPSLDSLKETLMQTATEQKRAAMFADQVAIINNMVADGFGVKDIAQEMKLTVKTLADYPQTNNQTPLNQPVVIKAAFDEFTIQDQGVSANIELPNNTIWVQPSNYRAASPMSLAQATENIRQTLIKQKASELALAEAQTIAKGVAKDNLSGFDDLGVIGRQSTAITEQERASLFAQEAGADEVAAWAVLTDEGASVFVGGEIQTQSQAQMDETQKTQAASIMRDIVGQDYLSDYVEYLRSVHQVEINKEALSGS